MKEKNTMNAVLNLWIKTAFVLFCCFIFLSQNTQAQSNWDLAKDKNGIQVYTRKTPNSDLKDYRVQAEFNTTPQNFLAVILDFDSYKDWFPNTQKCYLIKKISNTQLIQYYEAKAPWPVSNRDCVTKFDIKTKSNGDIRIELSLAKEYYDLNTDIVHISAFEGFWDITQIGNGKIKVTQQVATNPGGAIPAWLANMVVVDTPFDSFQALKNRF